MSGCLLLTSPAFFLSHLECVHTYSSGHQTVIYDMPHLLFLYYHVPCVCNLLSALPKINVKLIN